MEPVTGTVTLSGLMKARSLRVTPLSPEGRALDDKAISADDSPTGGSFALGKPATTWWMLEIER
jgi:hypothetical protein